MYLLEFIVHQSCSNEILGKREGLEHCLQPSEVLALTAPMTSYHWALSFHYSPSLLPNALIL